MQVDKRLADIQERIAKTQIEKELVIKDALTSNDVEAIYKAQKFLKLNEKNNVKFDDKGKALMFDPLWGTGMGFYEKNTTVTYGLLRGMAKTPIISSIISSRKEQITEYCTPQQDRYSKGFRIVKKNDKNEELTDADKRNAEKITNFIMNCGFDEQTWFADDFESFTRKIIEDSLVLDQATFEVVQNRAKKPLQFYAIDAATIRLAEQYDRGSRGDSEIIDGYKPTYCQLWDGNIIAEWYPWELGFGIRNPQTRIEANGYGKSELEDLIQIITALLNSDTYNANFFKNGTAPKGALLVKKASGLNPDVIAEFRREWGGQLGGISGMHKTPILDAEHIEWMDLQKTNRDMEFSKYQEYLIKLACAMYKISPEEIGFSIQGTNSSGMGGSGRAGADKDRKYSQAKGLIPLLKSYERWLNKWIVGPFTNNMYEVNFSGMDAETSEQEEERLIKAVGSYMTVDEVRAQKGLNPHTDKNIGGAILNPVAMQVAMMGQQQAMMGDGGGEPQGGSGYDSPFASEEENPMYKSLLDDFDKLIDESKLGNV